MTTRPYELLARFAANGSIAGVSVRTITTVNGRDFESDPTPLSGSSDPAFAVFAQQFAAAAVAARDTAIAEKAAAVASLAKVQADLETATAQLAAMTAERDSLQEQLDAILNPVNPFPDANWQGFRVAALSDPAVQRVAAGNQAAWPLLLLYLAELEAKPARALDVAILWNMLETNTPVTPEEVQRINASARSFGIPFVLNAEGQIVQG